MENTTTAYEPSQHEREYWTTLHSVLDIAYALLWTQHYDSELAELTDQTLAALHKKCADWDLRHQPELLSCCDVLQHMKAHGRELDSKYAEWVV